MIGSSENRISYNGNGIATEFAYTFKILEKSDIKVLHVAIDGTEELLTKDYYVDMEKSVVLYPGYAPGAEIPEQNRPPILPVGERLVLYREVPITQESALDKHWPFNVIEAGLDKLTIICQQLFDRLQRSFYVSESTSTNFDTKIPIEAGKTFRVNDDGTGFEVTEDPVRVQQVAVSAKNDAEKARDAAQLARDTAQAWAEENAGTTPSLIGGAKSSKQWSEHIHGYVDTAVEDARIAKETAIKSSEFVGNIVSGELYNIYSSVADMKADTTLMAGQTVKTVGYYEVNDGGGAFYYIRAKLTDDVDDGGSLHELVNGLVAELIIENGTVNVKQFGAKSNPDIDDAVAFTDTIIFAATNKLQILLVGTIYIKSAVVINTGCSLTIYGNTPSNTSLIASSYDNSANIIFDTNGKITIQGVTNITFMNVGFKGDAENHGECLDLRSFRNRIINCNFAEFDKAIQVNQDNNWAGENQIYNCVFHKVNKCIVLNASSDGDINGCLADGTCTGSFISGGYDSGYKIQNNHDYSEGEPSYINGFNTLITGNYFDGFGKLVITGVGGFTINDNLFIGAETDANLWCIKLTRVVNHGLIVGNNVVVSGYATPVVGLSFINLDANNYVNNVKISGNGIVPCSSLLSGNIDKLYYKDIEQAYQTTAAIMTGGLTVTNNYCNINGNVATAYFEATGTPTSSHIIRLPGFNGMIWTIYWEYEDKHTDTIKTGVVINNRDLKINAYASIKSIKVSAFCGIANANANVKFLNPQ